LTQIETLQGFENPADPSRVRVVEAILASRAPSADDLCAVGAEFLRSADILDAGLEIRGLQQACSTMQPDNLWQCLWRLVTLPSPTGVEDSKITIRVRTLRRWIRTALSSATGGSRNLILDLLRADELIRLRLSGAAHSAETSWSDWALEAALAGQYQTSRLLGHGATQLAEAAARRQSREWELAQVAFQTSSNSTPATARSLRRLLATASAGSVTR